MMLRFSFLSELLSAVPDFFSNIFVAFKFSKCSAKWTRAGWVDRKKLHDVCFSTHKLFVPTNQGTNYNSTDCYGELMNPLKICYTSGIPTQNHSRFKELSPLLRKTGVSSLNHVKQWKRRITTPTSITTKFIAYKRSLPLSLLGCYHGCLLE